MIKKDSLRHELYRIMLTEARINMLNCVNHTRSLFDQTLGIKFWQTDRILQKWFKMDYSIDIYENLYGFEDLEDSMHTSDYVERTMRLNLRLNVKPRLLIYCEL